MNSRELSRKLAELEQELDDVERMDEEAVAFRYNGATKEDIEEAISRDIHEVEEQIEEEEKQIYAGWPDPAFRSMADVHRMRV